MSTTEEKRAKAEARKARLLARGSDRLARITGSGRPGEDAALYEKPRPTSQVASTSEEVSDPGEVDISYSRTSPESARIFGDSFTGDSSLFDMSSLNNPPPTEGAADISSQFPFPISTLDASNPLQQLLSFVNGTSAVPPHPRERPSMGRVVYELLHFLSIFALGIYAVLVLEPVSALVVGEEKSLKRWRGLRWEKPSEGLEGAVGKVPIFGMFATLEVVLQSTRYYMNQNRFSPPSLLAAVAPHLPPHIARALITGGSYWALLSGILDDLAVLLFIVGFFMMWGNVFS